MAKTNEPTDAQILSRLRRSSKPKSAASLGTTSARLRALGAVEQGRVKTGKAGRPAILFGPPAEDIPSDAELARSDVLGGATHEADGSPAD
jgi:hypothetical protein